MTTHLTHRMRRAALGVVAAASLLATGVPAASADTPLPVSSCTGTGSSAVCDLTLHAINSNLTLTQPYVIDPGGPAERSYATLPSWVFSPTSAAPAWGAGGPTLVVPKGATVHITLNNDLLNGEGQAIKGLSLAAPQIAGLSFDGHTGSDKTGIDTGGSRIYTFTASRLGTFLYEAGPTGIGSRATAMGLFGAIVVKDPGALSIAEDGMIATYNNEAMVQLSEVDPALNLAQLPDSSPEPLAQGEATSFDMAGFEAARYLVNGTDEGGPLDISAAASNNLLLRYINAGADNHSMGTLGLPQLRLAFDGLPLLGVGAVAVNQTFGAVVQALPAGSSADTLVSIPTTVVDGQRFPIFDNGKELEADGAGMLRFVTIGNPLAKADCATNGGGSPIQNLALTSNDPAAVTTDPSRVGVGADKTLAISGLAVKCSSDLDTRAAGFQWKVDDGIYQSGQQNAGVIVDTVDPQGLGLATGLHHLYARTDLGNGKFGAVSAVSFVYDSDGPVFREEANGSLINGRLDRDLFNVDNPTLRFSATASDHRAGGSTVTGYYAAYGPAGSLPAGPTSGTPATAITNPAETADVASDAVAGFSTTGLLAGRYVLAIWAQDELGNWTPAGYEAVLPFTIDHDNPTNGTLKIEQGYRNVTGGWTLSTTNNGTLRYDPNEGAIRVVVKDPTDQVAGKPGGHVVAARGIFEDNYTLHTADRFCGSTTVVGNPAFGARLDPRGNLDAQGNEQQWFAYVPLASLNPLIAASKKGHGNVYHFFIRVQDAAGNWSDCTPVDETLDLVNPTVTFGTGVVLAAGGAAPTRAKATVRKVGSRWVLRVTALSSDSKGSITYGEWFDGKDPGRLHGNVMRASDGKYGSSTETLIGSASVAKWKVGDHQISVRVRDAAGNWSKVVTQTVTIRPKYKHH